MNKWHQIIFFYVIVTLASATSAHAYVDPGSGSVLVTSILGLIAAIGYTVRKHYYKIKRFFAKGGSEDGQVK